MDPVISTSLKQKKNHNCSLLKLRICFITSEGTTNTRYFDGNRPADDLPAARSPTPRRAIGRNLVARLVLDMHLVRPADLAQIVVHLRMLVPRQDALLALDVGDGHAVVLVGAGLLAAHLNRVRAHRLAALVEAVEVAAVGARPDLPLSQQELEQRLQGGNARGDDDDVCFDTAG